MRILLTGGAGYIGAHTAVELAAAGAEPVLLDNFSNSSPVVLDRLEALTGRRPEHFEIDLLDEAAVAAVFDQHRFDAVIHFAGLKAVGESVADPLRYYRVNLGGTINLLSHMIRTGVQRLVFSSSATVYGEPVSPPIREDSPVLDATNPYGRTKLMIERILEDVIRANPALAVVRLRYFNPAGAHESGTIGEDPAGIPNNLMPYITQTAVGARECLTVHGDDYETPDGTCIRDYLHVVDLARGHLAALQRIENESGLYTYNLGSGQGSSVLEMIRAFERANDLTLPFRIGPRRPGDIPASFTDPTLANEALGWKAERTIVDICRDAWRWQQQNPEGYRKD